MHIDLPSLSLIIEHPIAIAGGAGARIHVADGRIWLTEEDCLEDVFLGPGASYTLKQPGRVVIESEGTARVTVEAHVSVEAERPLMSRLASAWQALAHRVSASRRGWSTPAFAQ